MARYIKANPKVAQHLRLEQDRNRLQDGNYLLWQADMLAFGKLIDLPQILEQIGGLALLAHEARQEQDGSVLRELPVATDPRFIIEPVEAEQAPGIGDAQPETEAPKQEEPEAEVKPEPEAIEATAPEAKPEPEPKADLGPAVSLDDEALKMSEVVKKPSKKK